MKVSPAVRRRLADDARAFRYGDESFRFYWAMARLHDAEWRGRKREAQMAWREVQSLAESLDSYYVPFDYDYKGPGMRAKTGLARTQLQSLVDVLRDRYVRG